MKSLWEIEIAEGYVKSLCFNFVNFSVNLKNLKFLLKNRP